jgi:hypothetical protein
MIKFGSVAVARDIALACVDPRRCGVQKKQARWGFAMNTLMDLQLNVMSGHYGFLYVLNELSPCDCLRKELREEAKRSSRDALFRCACCGTRETSVGQFGRCNGCKTTFYCSEDCQADHWHDGFHKRACKGIQQLVALTRSTE